MGTLYSIATPIGNLEDITYRAVRILGQVKVIFCEDTRTSRVLLQHYGITTPTRAYHQHSSPAVINSIIAQLAAGDDLAIITDAGTPGISDPGGVLITAALHAGHNVVPIPGPSALICTLQAAGVDTSRFTFLGFLPHKKGRATLLEYIRNSTETIVFYESIHRLDKTIQALADSKKYIVVARELTKTFEEFIRGDAASVAKQIAAHPTLKGECVVVVADDTAKLRSHAEQ